MEECNFKDSKLVSKDGKEKKNENQMDFEAVKNLLESEDDREVYSLSGKASCVNSSWNSEGVYYK